MILLPRDSSLYTQCRVHNGNLLGDVSINHTSAVDVVCDCVRMSALVCVWGEGGQLVGPKACACWLRVRVNPKFLRGYLADHYDKRQAQLSLRCSPTSQAYTGGQRFTTVAVGSPTLWPPLLSSPAVSAPPHLASQEHVCLLWTCYTQKLKHSGGTWGGELGLF